jgi:hypothetical protein
MNILKKENNKIIKLESYWRFDKDDLRKDDLDNLYPIPKEGKFWTDKEQFLDRLTKIERFLLSNKRFFDFDKSEKCLLCHKNKLNDESVIVGTGHYLLENIIWKNSLVHYILEHNIKPSNEFMDFIYQFDDRKKNKITDFEVLKVDGSEYMIDDIKYLKVNRNQILIFDALMVHGGFKKKYSLSNDLTNLKYSEHMGLLDFDQHGLDKVIISAKTTRVDEGDDEIFMPKSIKESLDFEYIFHTHPPTPNPGSRAIQGILYEFPSVSDILHFLYHYNLGKTQGSIVVAPEGMYNIRKKNFNRDNIRIDDEDELIKELSKVHFKIQDKAIKKYGAKINLNKFYNEIAQDMNFIDEYNQTLNKYDIQIDYFPRIKDKNDNWFVDNIYLPVYVKERI